MDLTETADYVGQLRGRRPDRSTVWGWIREGVAGHRLCARKVGGRWAVEVDDVNTFLDAIDQTVTAR